MRVVTRDTKYTNTLFVECNPAQLSPFYVCPARAPHRPPPPPREILSTSTWNELHGVCITLFPRRGELGFPSTKVTDSPQILVSFLLLLFLAPLLTLLLHLPFLLSCPLLILPFPPLLTLTHEPTPS